MLPPRIVVELDAPCRSSLYGRFEVSGCIPLTNSPAVEGGVFTGLTTSGTYNVNSDCTGSITYTAGVAVNEKRGRSEGLGPPTSAKALVRRLCVDPALVALRNGRRRETPVCRNNAQFKQWALVVP